MCFACHRVFLDLKAPSDHLVKKYVFCNRLEMSEFLTKLSVMSHETPYFETYLCFFLSPHRDLWAGRGCLDYPELTGLLYVLFSIHMHTHKHTKSVYSEQTDFTERP